LLIESARMKRDKANTPSIIDKMSYRLSYFICVQLFGLLLIGVNACAQATSNQTQQPCCGVITPAAQHMLQTLDSMHVEDLWLAHQHVNWETGIADRDADYQGPGKATHCSAFAAAVGKRFGVYLLRPPEHSQILLANAQTAWLSSQAAINEGWSKMESAKAAQSRANLGELVVIVYQSPNPKKPGHIAIVRPSLKTQSELDRDGPQVTQAGTHNHNDWNARDAFHGHIGAWPDGVQYFSHGIHQTTATN